MKFIATADWQLGMQAHYLSDEARARFRQARFDAVRRIGELADQHGAEFVVVGGDVFETNQLERSVVAKTCEALRSIPVPVVLLPGNHDPLDSASIYDSPDFLRLQPEHVHVVRSSEPFEVVDGVEIVGAHWTSKAPGRDLVAEACASLQPPEEGRHRIILGHGAVSTLDPDRDNLNTIGVPSLAEKLDAGIADFVVLGDKHSTTAVTDRIWYPGSPEVTHRREVDPGNVLLVTIEDDVTVEPLRTGVWRFVTLEARVDEDSDVEQLRATLDAMPDKALTALWLKLEGTISTSTHTKLEQAIDDARDVFARIDHWERHTDLAIVPDDSDFSDLALSGYAQQALDDLLEQADASEDAVAALGLLYRFTEDAR